MMDWRIDAVPVAGRRGRSRESRDRWLRLTRVYPPSLSVRNCCLKLEAEKSSICDGASGLSANRIARPYKSAPRGGTCGVAGRDETAPAGFVELPCEGVGSAPSPS